MSVLIHGMQGLGDNIYQRPLVKMLARDEPVYLATPWPELYADLPNVHFVKRHTVLRTQAKNRDRQLTERWVDVVPPCRGFEVSYRPAELKRHNIPAAIAACFGVPWPHDMDLPDFGPCPLQSDRPIALIRPVTLRKEWLNTARAPRPEYIAQIAADLMTTHNVVSVADLADKQEWLHGEVPPAHITLHRGELPVDKLLALLQHAAVIVGGVGWIVPAAIAARRHLFCVLGGQGGHNGPDKITTGDMDTSRIGWGVPANFCGCTMMQHDCDKRIDNLMEQWHGYRQQHGI